jgi:drug/metabolite transporter (DMT)-like permease
MSQMSTRAWGLLILLSVLWGGSFLFVGLAVREWPPLSIALSRVALAALALWLFIAWQRETPRLDGPALRAHAGMGLLNNAIPFALIIWAQGTLPAGVAAIFNATTPLFAVLVAHAAATERATPLRIAGVGLGMLGVAAMVGADPLATPWPAAAAMLCATFSYALAGQWGRRFRELGVPPIHAAAGQTSASTLLLLPLALWVEQPGLPGQTTLVALLGLALLSTAFAYAIYFRLLALAGPVNLLLVTLLIPVSSFALGAMFLGESLALRHLLGMAGIALGLALIDGRLFRRNSG